MFCVTSKTRNFFACLVIVAICVARIFPHTYGAKIRNAEGKNVDLAKAAEITMELANMGSAALNPFALGLMVVSTAANIGARSYMKIKEVAEWEKKENDAMCSLNIQTYQHTTDTLQTIKITAMIGELALDYESKTGGSFISSLGNLIKNTENMCDLVVKSRAQAYAAAVEACKDKPTVRSAFMLADMELGTMHCSQLFQGARTKKIVADATTSKLKDRLDDAAGMTEHDETFGTSVDVIFEAAKQGAFTGDVTHADVFKTLKQRFEHNAKFEKVSVYIPIINKDGSKIIAKELKGKVIPTVLAKLLPKINEDGTDMQKEIAALLTDGSTSIPAFTSAVRTYSGEAVDSYVEKHLEEQILEPILNSVFVDAVQPGLAFVLPEFISQQTASLMGGLGGLLAGEIGKELNKILSKKIEAFTINGMKKMIGPMREKNMETYEAMLCKYYKGEADLDVQHDAFLHFVYNFINIKQVNDNSGLAQLMRVPAESCKILFRGKSGLEQDEASVEKTCETYTTKQILWKLMERYSDGVSFDSSACNVEMCLANFHGPKTENSRSDSVPSCTALCNHAAAVSSMDLPNDHWYEAKTIADSLSKFLRLAEEKRVEHEKEINDGLDKYCKAPAMKLSYDIKKRVRKVMDTNPELAELMGRKPSGGTCTPAAYFVAQGLVKAVANAVMSDYNTAPHDTPILKTARQILETVQEKFNMEQIKIAENQEDSLTSIKDKDCTWNYNKLRCEPQHGCAYRYDFLDMTLSESCRAKKSIKLEEYPVGKCCLYGSTCNKCEYGSEHVWPATCMSSRRCAKPGEGQKAAKEEKAKADKEADSEHDTTERPENDEGCKWDYDGKHQCEPARWCEHKYKFKDWHLGQSCRLIKIPPPRVTCDKEKMTTRRVKEGYANCIAEQYAREKIAPALNNFCQKIPEDATESDGTGAVRTLCLDAARFLTEDQNLLGDGAEDFERIMIEHTGIYGYEIMFANYAFETIPGAKAGIASTASERGDLSKLSAIDDLPELALGKTLSEIAVRRIMKAAFKAIREQVLSLMVSWKELSLSKEKRYEEVKELMNDEEMLIQAVKDISEKGMPENTYYTIDKHTADTKEVSNVKKYVSAGLDVLDINRIEATFTGSWMKGTAHGPLRSPLNEFGLDCQFTDVRYLNMLSNAIVPFKTFTGKSKTNRVFKRFLAAFEASLTGKQRHMEKRDTLTKTMPTQDATEKVSLIESHEVSNCDKVTCAHRSTDRKHMSTRKRIRKCFGRDYCCMPSGKGHKCVKMNCKQLQQNEYVKGKRLSLKILDSINFKCRKLVDGEAEDKDENEDSVNPVPVPKQQVSRLNSISKMNEEGKIFAPFASLISGSKNWIRWRSTSGFSYMKFIFLRSSYAGKYMPEGEMFYQPDYLTTTCGAEEKTKLEAAKQGKGSTDESKSSNRDIEASSLLQETETKYKEGQCCWKFVDCSRCEHGNEFTFYSTCTSSRRCKAKTPEVKNKRTDVAPNATAPQPIANQDCRWNSWKFRCEPQRDCQFKFKIGDMTLDHSCRAIVTDKSDDKDQYWKTKPEMNGKCCYWGSTCNSCQFGSEYISPYHCKWTSRRCKEDPEKIKKRGNEDVTDADCVWSFTRMECVGPNDNNEVCEHQWRWPDATLSQSCRAVDKGIKLSKNVVNNTNPPQSDSQCFWSYDHARCEPTKFCKRQYRFKDMHLSQSCRLIPGLLPDVDMQGPSEEKVGARLVNCGVRSIIEGEPDGHGMYDTYEICSSGDWELDSKGCNMGEECSNAPSKTCDATGFGWDDTQLLDSNNKRIDIMFTVPLSFRKAEYIKNSYQYVSLSKPQQTALETELSEGGLPVNDKAKLDKAICEVCMLLFDDKKINEIESNNGYSAKDRSRDCFIACTEHLNDKLDRCLQKCEMFVDKYSGSWRGVEHYDGDQDLKDRICSNAEKVFSSDILKKLRKQEKNSQFLKCSTKNKFVGITYRTSTRSLWKLLREYKLAVKTTTHDLETKKITAGYTTKPCDTYHTGYCPVSFKPTPHLWSVNKKEIYKREEHMKQEKKRKEKMSAEEIRDEKIAAAKNVAGVSNEKCTFTCMKNGDREHDDKIVCNSLQNLSVDCVKCGDNACQKRAKTRCVDYGTGTCNNPSIEWKGHEEYIK